MTSREPLPTELLLGEARASLQATSRFPWRGIPDATIDRAAAKIGIVKASGQSGVPQSPVTGSFSQGQLDDPSSVSQPSSERSYPEKSRIFDQEVSSHERHPSSVQQFLARVGGADVDILSQVPHDAWRFQLLGVLILLSSMLAGLSIFLGTELVGFSTAFSYIFAFCMTTIVYSMDRLLFGQSYTLSEAYPKRLLFLKRLLLFIPRVTLSALIAWLWSIPLVLRIFDDAITSRLGRPPIGILESLAVLQQLRQSSLLIETTFWATSGLFVVLWMMPVLLSALPLPSAYNALLSSESQRVIAEVEYYHQRKQLQRASEMAEDALNRLDEVSARLAHIKLGQSEEVGGDPEKVNPLLLQTRLKIADDFAKAVEALGGGTSQPEAAHGGETPVRATTKSSSPAPRPE